MTTSPLRPRLRNALTALLIPLLLCLWTLHASAAPDAAAQDAVYVLALTDFHGALEDKGKQPGLARLTSAVKAFERQHPHTLLVAVGDLFTGSVESDLLRGKPVLDGLLAAGLRLSAVGNHEFDWEAGDIARWSRAGLPFLSANIQDAQGRAPDGIDPWRILESGGLRIAFVGLTTTSTPKVSKADNVRGLRFLPPFSALRTAVDDARRAGADAVIVLAHLAASSQHQAWPDGIAPSIQELAKVPGVSAIVYGHSHEEHLARIGTVPVVQPAYKGGSLAVLTLRRDAAGAVAVTAALDQLSRRKDELPPDPAAERLVSEARAALGPQMDAVVARTARTLSPDDSAPSLLGEVVCDALRVGTGADVAMTNGGGLRAPLEQGNITLRDLYRTFPFENSVRVLRLTGAELRLVLEHGIVGAGDSGEPSRFVQMSGIRVTYDLERPKGQRITSMTWPDGRPVTAESSLRVAMNSFLAKGGDGYPLRKAGAHRESTNIRERNMVKTYLEAQGELHPEFKAWLKPVK